MLATDRRSRCRTIRRCRGNQRKRERADGCRPKHELLAGERYADAPRRFPTSAPRSSRWNRRLQQLWPGTASTLRCRSRPHSRSTGAVMDSARIRPAGRPLGRAPRRLGSRCRGLFLLVGTLGAAMTTHHHHRHQNQPHHPRHEDEGREGDRDEDVRIHLSRH